MNYIDEIKEELNKHITVGKGLQNVYALLVLVKGEECTLKDVHDAWAVNININMPDHRSLIPFEDLSVETQEKDREYTEAIQETARIMKLKENTHGK